MAYNCKIELSGNLGADPKIIEKEEKIFVALSVATTDSYPKKEGDKTIWENSKTTLWHDVLIFRPTAIEVVKKLKKGDRVDVIGSLSYRSFKDENGINRKQASIIAGFVNKIEFDAQPTEDEISVVSEEVARF